MKKTRCADCGADLIAVDVPGEGAMRLEPHEIWLLSRDIPAACDIPVRTQGYVAHSCGETRGGRRGKKVG